MPEADRALAHDGFNGAFPVVVDLSTHSTTELKTLKRLGVKVVIRYFALKKQGGGLKEKILEENEADAILNSGLSLAISYQYNNGSISTFNPDRAKLDAEHCITRANEIGQPKGSTIYFGVDEGWDKEAEIKKVIGYFSTLNQIVTANRNRFEVGVYGSGLMCRRLREERLAKYFWIAGLSDAWPERPQFVETTAWNMYQNVLEVPIGAVKVDTNVVNPRAALIGSFHRTSPDAPATLDSEISNQAVLNVQRIVKGKDVSLFDKPGGKVIRKLVASKMVTRIEEIGDWAMIDVPRQIPGRGGKVADWVRGYCPKAALSEIG